MSLEPYGSLAARATMMRLAVRAAILTFHSKKHRAAFMRLARKTPC